MQGERVTLKKKQTTDELYNMGAYQTPAAGQMPTGQMPAGQQQEPARSKSTFLLGLITGVIFSALIVCLVYTSVRLIGIYRTEQLTVYDSETMPNSIVNEASTAKLAAIEDIIDEYYYKEEDIDVEAMMDGMYAGAVSALGDPYSVYYTAEEWEELMEETEGVYYGIGAYLTLDSVTGYGMVTGVIADTPAEEAGLRANDIIYMIDGESAYGLTLTEIVARIKGEEGTTVHLTIYREGESDYLEMDVMRRQIETPTVEYEMYDNGVGYIQISEFDDVTLDQFTEALAVVKGSDAKGLILDLRSNPGGSLSVVVDIAREILPEGLIVYTEDRSGKRTEYTCNGENELQIPLVVLVDGNSASASEILAGAIKDYQIGTLVGTTTFGKGIVQRVMSLTDGTALKLTVSAYYTPSGHNIHGIGIEPDIVCEFDSTAYYDEGVDNQLEKALEVIEGMIE